MIQLAIAGALGRTGRRVLELAAGDDRFHVAAALTSKTCSDCGSTIRAGGIDIRIVDRIEGACDVLIDFSTPAGTLEWLEFCRGRGIAMVIGTTGHNEKALDTIRTAAKQIPILVAANFSVGIEVVRRAVGEVVKRLGVAYDVEIVETHHRMKVDAPSGTALLLAKEIENAKKQVHSQAVEFVHGREGAAGPRKTSEVGIHAVRMGEIVGQHEVYLSGPGETIMLKHTAHSRDTFAAGALRAAAWIAGKRPGLYAFGDIFE